MMRYRYCLSALLTLLSWVFDTPLLAHSAGRSNTPVAVLSAPFTSTMTMLANPTINVPTAADYRNGVTISQSTLQVSGVGNVLYNLQIKASSVNLTSGVNTIPVSLVGVTITTAGIGATGERRLTTAYQSLGAYNPPTAYTNYLITLQYKLYSDPALLKPAGSYTTTITFLLTP